MATPSADHLRKIGVEGFALIDKFYGPSRRSNNSINDGRRERCWMVYQVPNDVMEEPYVTVTSKDAALQFGGISVVNCTKAKPQNRWGRPLKF